MNTRTRLIRSLLRVYPAPWRAEYGPEFEALLASRPLTLSVALDVICNALIQRVRGSEPWKVCAAFLLVFSTAATVWNSLRPFSNDAYSCFGMSNCLALFASAFWTTSRGTAGIKMAALGAVKAAVISGLPDMLVYFFWISGIAAAPVLGLDGSPAPQYRSVALLYVRASANVPVQTSPILLFWEVFGLGLIGLIFGSFGATMGRILHLWSARRHRA